MLSNLSYDVLIFNPQARAKRHRKTRTFNLPSIRTVMLPLHQCRKCTYCSKYIELFWLFRIIYCNIPLTNINQTSPSAGTPCAILSLITLPNSSSLADHTCFYTRGLVMPLYHQWLTLFFTSEGSAAPTINTH